MAICTKRLRGSSSRKRTVVVLIVCIWLLAIPLALPHAYYKKVTEFTALDEPQSQSPASQSLADDQNRTGEWNSSYENTAAAVAAHKKYYFCQYDDTGKHYMPYYILFAFVPFDYVLPVCALSSLLCSPVSHLTRQLYIYSWAPGV